MVITTFMTYWMEEETSMLFPVRPAIENTYWRGVNVMFLQRGEERMEGKKEKTHSDVVHHDIHACELSPDLLFVSTAFM